MTEEMTHSCSSCSSCSTSDSCSGSTANDVVNPDNNKESGTTTNACKVCSPLGASLVFKGIRGCIPLMHGSQGCATYIRRYMISHFREPLDIASTNFTEKATVFGGENNMTVGLDNIISQYEPEVVGIATTCLSETIGDDVNLFLNNYKKLRKDKVIPEFVSVSTPSYQGTHMEGFHAAVKSVVECLGDKDPDEMLDHINIFPGFVSTEDLRHVKEILEDFKIEYIMVPDYSETMDNPTWDKYHRLPEGGVPIETLRKTTSAQASIEFGHILNKGHFNPTSAAEYLETSYGVERKSCGLPIGIKETDEFFKLLEQISGEPTPDKYKMQRGRLIDAYVDGHKYIFGKKAFVYGEEDFVLGMVSFLEEIGIKTVLVGTGGESGLLEKKIKEIGSENAQTIIVKGGVDFEEMKRDAETMAPDLLIGNSKGYYISRDRNIPLVRCGFPVHDRIGAQRIQHLSYEGTQQLFDSICNALIEYKQENSPVGYKYI